MKIIEPSYVITDKINGIEFLKKIEKAGRTCYKSEDKITETSAKKFITTILNSGHESVIEHEKISVRFICDRGITHEIVRHRIASFSQESTRYCNYSKGKYGSEITVIRPFWWNSEDEKTSHNFAAWENAMHLAERQYLTLLAQGCSAQQARSVLPNSLKTEIVVTANLREWRTIFKQRTPAAAHPQMRQLMIPLCRELKTLIPVIFDDIQLTDEFLSN